MLEQIFLVFFNMTLIGSCVVLVILAARLLIAVCPKVYSYALWSIAALRLLCPFSLESARALIPVKANAVTPELLLHTDTPKIDTGITAIDEAVSTALPFAADGAAANSMQTVISLLAIVWAAGVLMLAAYNWIAVARLRRHLQWAEQIEPGYFVSTRIHTPFVLGLFRPCIYLPAGLTKDERELILLHERAHISRFDHLAKLLGFVVLALHWFNPLVWLAFRCFERDMEMSCDEVVLRGLTETQRADYSTLLLGLATGRRLAAPHLAFGESDTSARIKRILRYHRPAVWMSAIALTAVFLLCGCMLFSPAAEETQGKVSDGTESTMSASDFDLSIWAPREVTVTFPAYALCETQPDISPFTVTLELPAGWTLAEPSEEEKGSSGSGTPLYFSVNGSYRGYIDYSTAAWVEEGAGEYRMYFQGYMGGSIVSWDTDFQMLRDEKTWGVATTKVSVNQQDGVSAAASSTIYYPAVLAYLRDGDQILQVAIQFTAGALSDSELTTFAEHITVEKN